MEGPISFQKHTHEKITTPTGICTENPGDSVAPTFSDRRSQYSTQQPALNILFSHFGNNRVYPATRFQVGHTRIRTTPLSAAQTSVSSYRFSETARSCHLNCSYTGAYTASVVRRC